MPDLTLHGRPVRTVFDLLGDKENDITYAVGWALSQSDGLATELLGAVFDDRPIDGTRAVRLQEFLSGGGLTDVEVRTDELHLIVEAKRGWNLPTSAQLEQYAPRI